MDIESLRTTAVEFVRHNQGWAPFIVAVLAFGESLAFMSLLFPATVLLVAIGATVGGLGRFFGPLRAFVPLAAGIFEMPRTPFQIANITSALLWAYILLKFGDVTSD